MNLPYSPYISSLLEGWEDLVDWTGELHDTIFEGDSKIPDAQNNSLPDTHLVHGSATADHQRISASSFLSEGLPSIGYTVSGPPSLREGNSSFGQVCDPSPWFDTTATSSFIEQNNEQYFGSFGASDEMISPSCYTHEPPILDTRYERIVDSLPSSAQNPETTKEEVFNPHVVGSLHSFSGLDLKVSQVLSDVGTWPDQPQIIEPIAEHDGRQAESHPILIPQPNSNVYSDAGYSPSEKTYQSHGRSRAITIPKSSQRPASYSNSASHSRRSQRLTPTLSVSPVAHRLARSCTLSRSTSQSRRKLVTPSPTESFGWVSYQPNPLTHKLAPTSIEGMQGRTPRGRKKGLSAEGRKHAALMRIVGACANCQRGKRKCDEATPCKPCLEHYKGDLVNHPCRDRLLTNLTDAFLSDRLGWHPTARSTESFVAPGRSKISKDSTCTIPVIFGFGPELMIPVHPLRVEHSHSLIHTHIIYSWPPERSSKSSHNHAVLPAVLSTDTSFDLQQVMDTHLSMLVINYFREFPLYLSPLRLLKDIYILSCSLPPSSPHAHALHQALKLLVLVHIGGDITLPSPPSHATLASLISTTMSPPLTPTSTPTPCFIRAQFGAIMPNLASFLMKDVLASLEQLLLTRNCDNWPIALAFLLLVLMTVESIQYHAAKLPYHHHHDRALNQLPDHTYNHQTDHTHNHQPDHTHNQLPTKSTQSTNAIDATTPQDDAVATLLAFYSACYADCHARLRPDWNGESHTPQPHQSQSLSPEDVFVQGVRAARVSAGHEGYLARKAGIKKGGADEGMEGCFDRLVARALVLEC